MTAPKLRFKEFDGDWTFKNLSDVSNKPLYGMNSAATDFDGENKYLRITDIDEESHRFKFTKLSSPSDVIEEKYILQEGDLLFARTGASVGKSYIYDPDDGKVVFAGFLIKFGLKESVIPYFIFTQTLSEKFNNWVITNSMRSGQPGINAEEYSKWQIAFTSKPEQIKIVSFLSTVDEKISQLNQKHELLSQYKQGMMQKLFGQQIRFKADDGREFGEWVFSEIGGVFKFKQGKQVPIEDQNLNMTDTSARFIRIVDLTSRNEPPRYIVDYSKNDLIKKDDLFMVRYGSPGLLGFGYEGVIANNLFRIIPIHPKQVYSKFSYHLFDSLYQQVCQLSSSTTMPAISFASLNTLKVCLPSLEEQTKIANFLSTIDQKIEVVAQQIEQAKTWKKGLLQQMFV